jgi:hypothetical protein
VTAFTQQLPYKDPAFPKRQIAVSPSPVRLLESSLLMLSGSLAWTKSATIAPHQLLDYLSQSTYNASWARPANTNNWRKRPRTELRNAAASESTVQGDNELCGVHLILRLQVYPVSDTWNRWLSASPRDTTMSFSGSGR